MDPSAAEKYEPGYRRQDSQVNLKAPTAPEFSEQFDTEAPFDFVEFISLERGISASDALDLLCRLVAEYRTPVRREIDVLQLSA
jgi:hypothetical protein